MHEDNVFDWEEQRGTVEISQSRPQIPQRKPPSKPRLNLNGRKVGNILYMTRAVKGLTQQELADKVGVSVKTINAIENQRSAPTVYLAIGIARVLDTGVENIFILHETWPARRLDLGNPQH